MKNLRLKITDKQVKIIEGIVRKTDKKKSAIYSAAFSVGLEAVAKEAKNDNK